MISLCVYTPKITCHMLILGVLEYCIENFFGSIKSLYSN